MLSSAVRLIRNYGLTYCLHAGYRRIFRPSVSDLKNYLSYVENKRGLEVGGPSKVFGKHGLIPLYDYVGALDNCNFASETLWQRELKSGPHFVFSKCKPPGTQFVVETAELNAICGQDYDFVLSSHMIEHTANPLGALRSWFRCLRPGGALVLLVPDKEWTFDHRRRVTSLDHLKRDLEAGAGEDDLTHLPEILRLHDLERDPEAGDFAAFKARSERNLENRCLHHHVFNAALIRQVLEYTGYVVTSLRSLRPNHIIAIAAKPGDG